MQTVFVQNDDIDQWDAFVAEADAFAMMQSWRWGDVKEKLGWTAHRVGVADAGEIVAAAQVLIKRFPFGVGSLAYIPRGPVGEWLDREIGTQLFDALHVVARENHAVFLKIEPAVVDGPEVRNALSNVGFRSSPQSNQPRATIVMDIAGDQETVLRSMRNSTRRKIQSAERKGVVVRRGGLDDLGTFYELMRITAERTGSTLRDVEYYQTEFRTFDKEGQALLLLADYEGETLGAHIVYAFGKHAAFFHQASSEGRSNLNPNCLLVWEQIKWAMDKGCSTMDLWGIPDEAGELAAAGEEIPTDRTGGLWGVYRFKSGFSHNIVNYAGSFDYVYAPRRYALVLNRLSGDGALERISSLMDTRLRR